ncbi:MAG: hypothetical protein HZA78_06130 [Candidatus Schekmanbacteria bacterium]|nr:hypothetical protein [Candidatus Schekmanbacteria bacterium]
MKKFLLGVGIVALLIPTLVSAGPHDDCTLCHGVHSGQGPVILTETPNTTTINPRTGQPLKRIGSLCLACHAAEPDGAGYRPIDLNHTHPVGFTPDPKKVVLPPESKGFPGEEEDVVCTSCHNQHPANTFYMYLRWDSDGGQNLPKFCVHCHPKQSRSDVRSEAGMKE